MDMETTLFVSSDRWCCGTYRLTTAPANAPAKITANTKKAMINGENIVPFPLRCAATFRHHLCQKSVEMDCPICPRKRTCAAREVRFWAKSDIVKISIHDTPKAKVVLQ